MPRTIEVYADTRGVGLCNGPHCGAQLTWVEVVQTGKRMCFTGNPTPLQTRHDEAQRLIEVLDLDENHWASCPDMQQFKAKR
jgi:hypothetical protein